MHRPLFAALILFGLSLVSTGCSSRGTVHYRVASGDWDEVKYSYLNVQSAPEGAIVSVQVTGTFDMIAETAFKDDIKGEDTDTSDWTVIGNTPVLSYKVATACSDVQRKGRTTVRNWYKVDKFSVRIEKPGYETITLESVGLNANKDDQTKLVVELEPTKSRTN